MNRPETRDVLRMDAVPPWRLRDGKEGRSRRSLSAQLRLLKVRLKTVLVRIFSA